MELGFEARGNPISSGTDGSTSHRQLRNRPPPRPHSNTSSSFLNVNSCSWIESQCSRFLLRRFSGGWFYIKILTGMLMLSKLYLLAIFNLQIYIMLKLLVSRQLKRRDYKLRSVFIYTEWSTVQTKGRRKGRAIEKT
jgi:hypothetical protein